MGVPVDKHGKVVPYFCVPHAIWESAILNIYDKAIYCSLAKCGPRVFPSLIKISKSLKIAKNTTIKSLKKLEKCGIIKRFKLGKKVYYSVYFEKKPDIPDGASKILYSNTIGSFKIPMEA